MRAWSTQLANERLGRKELEDREMADYWAYLERVRKRERTKRQRQTGRDREAETEIQERETET